MLRHPDAVISDSDTAALSRLLDYNINNSGVSIVGVLNEFEQRCSVIFYALSPELENRSGIYMEVFRWRHSG